MAGRLTRRPGRATYTARVVEGGARAHARLPATKSRGRTPPRHIQYCLPLALGTPRLTTQNDPPMCKRPPVDRLSILPPLSAASEVQGPTVTTVSGVSATRLVSQGTLVGVGPARKQPAARATRAIWVGPNRAVGGENAHAHQARLGESA